MSEIQVEVCFTDKLESVRVGGKPMEIPKAVKAKPVEEWFEPAAGRVKWGGLGAEIKEMDFNGEKNAAYSFLFNGPEDKKQEFMACVERFCLGEEAQQETKKKTVQDYLQEAKKNQQAGNAEAQCALGECYYQARGVEKDDKEARRWYEAATASARTRQRPQNCTARRQCRAMRKRRTNSASATTMEVAWQLMKMKLRSGIRKPQKMEMKRQC